MNALPSLKTRAYLVVRSGPAAGQRAEIVLHRTPALKVPVFIVGRDPRCHLTLDDPALAPAHAFVIRSAQGVYHIKDNNTRAGVMLDGEAVTLGELYPGCVLRIGKSVLHFETAEAQVADLLREPAPPSAALSMQAAARPAAAPLPPPKPIAKKSGGGSIATLLMIGVFAVFSLLLVYAVLTDERLNPPDYPDNYVPVDYSQPRDAGATVLFFTADWCSYCRMQQPIVRSVDDAYGTSVTFRTVDVDSRSNEQLVRQFNVRSIPSIVVLDGWNHTIEQFTGVIDANNLSYAINEALMP